MMQSLSLSQLVPVLNAELANEDAYFDGVSTDTRTLKSGDLFVALSGKQFDAHDFLQTAKEKGASAALVNHFIDNDFPQLKVKDTRLSLGSLGAFNRRQFKGPVIAVTGSNGKTTVKEMIAAILRCRGDVLATQGNLNNDIGAPLTLLSLSKHHAYAVIELGASAIGEIAYTAQLTQPHVSVLTNASNAHVEGFGSLAGVVEAKGEIFDVLEDSKGVAIINVDDAHAPVWLERAKHKKITTFSVSTKTNADYFSTNITLNAIGQVGFLLHTPAGEIDIQLNLLGKHNVANALAAAAAAIAVGATVTDVKQGLEAMQAVNGRLNAKAGINQLCVIDDTYNANPNSMRAAIDCLAELPNKKIIVIGDMAELGDEAAAQHQQIGVYAKQKRIDGLYGMGALSALAVDGFRKGARHFNNHQAVIDELKKETQATILIKGSRSAHMEVVVQALLKKGEI